MHNTSFLVFLLSVTDGIHLDTVSRQIFGDIQKTYFSGSKMEVHVHLKNTFPGGIGNQRNQMMIALIITLGEIM